MSAERSVRIGEAPPLASREVIHLTLGELVEAVASQTRDCVERAVVTDHILRTRTPKCDSPPPHALA